MADFKLIQEVLAEAEKRFPKKEDAAPLGTRHIESDLNTQLLDGMREGEDCTIKDSSGNYYLAQKIDGKLFRLQFVEVV